MHWKEQADWLQVLNRKCVQLSMASLATLGAVQIDSFYLQHIRLNWDQVVLSWKSPVPLPIRLGVRQTRRTLSLRQTNSEFKDSASEDPNGEELISAASGAQAKLTAETEDKPAQLIIYFPFAKFMRIRWMDRNAY
jgi:hypothetical protein